MRCSDGVRLACRLWRPRREGPAPVLLMRQPYGRSIASTVTYAHPCWYAQHGFIVVVQDVRGRGASEGVFGGFAQEARDGAETVRWARGLPGGNGRVGMYGFSYQGLTQLLSASADGGPASPPSSPRPGGAEPRPAPDPQRLDAWPDCLAPACCGLDERLHWASEGGAHWWAIGLGWALQLAAQGCRRRGEAEAWLEIRRSLESGAFLREGPGLLERHDPEGMGLAWLRLDPRRPRLWRRHAVASELLRRPLLLIGGWHDPHLGGTLDLWQRARRAGGRPWLRIGAWTHLDWRGGLDRLQLAFFRAHLLADGGRQAAAAGPAPALPLQVGSRAAERGEGHPGLAGGRPAGPLPLAAVPAGDGWVDPFDLAVRCALQCGEEGPWRAPAPVAARAWRLASEGLAAVTPAEGQLLAWPQAPGPGSAPEIQPATPRQAGAFEAWEAGALPLGLVHDPWRAVPGRGGHLGLDAGVVAREDLDRRADVACFSSPPLVEPLLLQGRPQLRIAVQADQPGFDLCAALSVCSEDGRVWQLSTGVARFLGEDCLRLRRRRLQLQPLLRQLQPGQRLRLSLAAAAWPQVAVNPGDGRQPWGGVSAAHREISLRFDLNDSRLWLSPLFGAN